MKAQLRQATKRTFSTIEEDEQMRWQHSIWTSRPHFEAMASACIVFMSGGMKLAWSVLETPSAKFASNQLLHQVMVTWFIGVIVGAMLAATFVQRVSKMVAHSLSGSLLICGGLLFICLPTCWLAISGSCLCEGCAFGLTQVQAVVTSAEVAPPYIRGLLLSFERVFFWLGICMQLLCTRFWFIWEPAAGHAFHVDQVHGIIVVSLGALTIILTLVHRQESPLLLLRQQLQHREKRQRQQPKDVVDVEVPSTHMLKRLLSVQFAEDNEQQEMSKQEECHRLLAYDAGLSITAAFWQRNAWPLLKVMCLRCFVALSFSLPFNRGFHTLSETGFHCDRNCIYLLPLCGLLGGIIGALRIDTQGRRRISVVSLLFAGVAIFIIGGILQNRRSDRNVSKNLDLEMAACLMLFYQFITSTGISTASAVYTGEAFTPSVKAKCIALAISAEQLMQISLAAITFSASVDLAALFFSMGSLSLLLGIMIFCFMPETKQLTLLQCLYKFNKFP